MKGVILAGGSGTRLAPMTSVISKQLLPIYDKPMIFYPLSTLMLARITDILVITTPVDAQRFKDLLQDGSQWGLSISYAVQETPRGIADALLIGERFIGDSPVALILGDNLFHGEGLNQQLQTASGYAVSLAASIFAYHVSDPERYGVAEFSAGGRVIDIEEKPITPRSSFAVTGLYFYPKGVAAIAKKLQPSPRGELEITDLNKAYLAEGCLTAQTLPRGSAWLDTGTPDALLEASSYVATIERRQGLKIACVEEIALRLGYIDSAQFRQLAVGYGQKTAYGAYLFNVMERF